jgi:hypothetical protein
MALKSIRPSVDSPQPMPDWFYVLLGSMPVIGVVCIWLVSR